jgi:hypothetical protein
VYGAREHDRQLAGLAATADGGESAYTAYWRSAA